MADRQVRLAFSTFQRLDHYTCGFIFTGDAADLSARVTVITETAGDDLPGFVRELSENFRGWTGTRMWRSLEDQLRIDATWRSGGHVDLAFHLRPSVYHHWTATIEITLEAGEELRNLGEELLIFMRA